MIIMALSYAQKTGDNSLLTKYVRKIPTQRPCAAPTELALVSSLPSLISGPNT